MQDHVGMIVEIIAFIALAPVAVGKFDNLAGRCKCGPDDVCWPSDATWEAFNVSVSGKLIANTPPAAVCYPGPQYDATSCAYVDEQWANAMFQSNNPIGLSYPVNISCPPVNMSAGEIPRSCMIGDSPMYTVNATEPEDIANGILFAKVQGMRLVVKDTGHDLLGRSTGYGSLEVWMRYLRKGITYQKTYKPSDGCSKCTWKGSAFTIGGGYTWNAVYPEAASRSLVVVGGGTPSVGCIGGWMQGGGHSPATHDFGLGADQVLETQVVLANGSIVTANSCQHSDLFFAIRGGGGGTYGVVISTTIKAWPTKTVVTQNLALAPLISDVSDLMEAIAIIYSAFPDLSDAGYSGYGTWSIASPTPLFSTFTTGYIHAISMFGKSVHDAKAAFAPVAEKLNRYNGTSLFVSVMYVSFPSYAAFYNAESGVEPAVGTLVALGSRLFDRDALTKDADRLRKMPNITAGTPEQFTSNNIVFVGGGQVFRDANDLYSGVNPAWRRTYVHNIVARGWAPGLDEVTIAAVHRDITDVKVGAMRDLAPDTGCYMNEADRLDPQYAEDFYGQNFDRLSTIKRRYDPESSFYCPTCVGSQMWKEQDSGKLCFA